MDNWNFGMVPACAILCLLFGFHPHFPRKSAAKTVLGSPTHHGLGVS